jgi:MFS family permease
MSIQVKESALPDIPHKVLLLGAAAICMALQVGAQYTFPVLTLSVSAELGWSRGATAGAVSLRFLLGAATQVLLGPLVDRFGPRRIGVLGSALVAVGLGCSAGISELWHLYLLFGGLVGMGATFLELCILAALTQHFSARRGTAVGIAWAGGGLGLFFLLPLAQALATDVGWRATYRVLGLAVACLVPLVHLTFPNPVAGQRIAEADARSRFTRRQALATRAFWLLFLGNVCIGVFDEAVFQHLVPFANHLGYPETAATSALGLAAILLLVGQIFGGNLSDHVGRERTASAASALTAAGLLLLLGLSGPTTWGLSGAMILYGMGLGTNLASRSATWGDMFQGQHFASIVGIIWSGYSLGGAFISWFGGWAFDLSHSYAPNFLVAIGATLLWCVALWTVAPRRLR